MPKLFAHLLILLSLSAVPLMVRSEPMKALAVSYRIESPITLHEPVIFHVTIKNVASSDISIDLGGRNRDFFHCRIITPDRREIDINYEHQALGELWAAIHLKPKETYSRRLLLNDSYSFDKAGNYSMTVSARIPMAVGKVSLLPYKASQKGYVQVVTDEARLSLVILPRDETALRKRCDALYTLLLQAREESDIQQVAEELSYVSDPIAIPYLSKLDKCEEWFAVQGLKRIDTEEAWEAMIPVANSNYSRVTSDYAKSLLRQKLPQIHDPKVRKKIQAAIGEN